MKKIQQLVELVDSDIDAAFDVLDDLFGNTDITYTSLSNKYVDRPENFAIATFARQLKRFIKQKRSSIESHLEYLMIDKNESTEIADDEFYALLYDLDFEHQTRYFNVAINNPCPIMSFVIRGEKKFGQRWLYHRFIKDYSKKTPLTSSPITLDLSANQSLDFLVDELNKRFGWQVLSNKYANKSLEDKLIILSNTLTDTIKKESIFIIFNNAYDFIHQEQFQSFYNVLNHCLRNTRPLDLRHKCIFFFVEEITQAYRCNEYCTFSKEVELAEIRSPSQQLKFIDLDVNTPISKSELYNWLVEKHSDVYNCLKDYIEDDTIFKGLWEECNNGNPESIIQRVCEKLIPLIGGDTNKTYYDYESSWLKH